MKNLFLFIVFTLILFSPITQGQERTISGKVMDASMEPLIGVSILVQETSMGTVSDVNGHFSLSLPNKAYTIIFTYVGYKTQSIHLEKADPTKLQDSLNILLKVETETLDEVVVTGLSPKMTKRDVSYSMSTISYDDTSPALKGKTSGLAVSGAESKKEMRFFSTETYEEVAIDDYSKDIASSPDIGAGVLTAGEVNDFKKWMLWDDIANEDLYEWQTTWQVHPKDRYGLQLRTQSGFPIVDAKVELLSTSGTTIWIARTDNTGKAELWANLFEKQEKAQQIRISYQNQSYLLDDIQSFQQNLNHKVLKVACNQSEIVDIAFVVDATGSMADEIDYLKAELFDVVNKVKDTIPSADVRLGSVFYRDVTDSYLVKHSPLSTNIKQTIEFIKKQSADGGGDTPEAVDVALETALDSLQWSNNAAARLLFLVLDAPPHQNPEVIQKMKKLMSRAAKMGIRIIPIACSGTTKSTEYLMRSIALSSNGTYLFLTDDSGIGNPHIEPTTDEYEVRKFNDLLIETIFHLAYVPSCEHSEQIDPIVADTSSVWMPSDSSIVKKDEPLDPIVSWEYYPNPTRGIVTIRINGEIGALYLSDFSGKILNRILIDEQKELQIDISQYPAGTYFLKYQYGDDQWLSGKLILIHS